LLELVPASVPTQASPAGTIDRPSEGLPVLAEASHRLELRITAEQNEASRGHACRIAYFAVNGS